MKTLPPLTCQEYRKRLEACGPRLKFQKLFVVKELIVIFSG